MTKKKFNVVVEYSPSGKRKVFINGVKLVRRVPGVDHCRDIYLGKDIVLKIDDVDSEYFNEQNNMEWEKWLTVKKTKDRDFFAPILKKTKLYLIQKRVRAAKRAPTEEDENIVNKITKRWGIGDVFGSENRNWAICAEKNHPVIYDYGIEE